MRIHRKVIVFMVTLLAVLALAGSASAGGRVVADPLPGWLETGIVVTLLVVGAIYVLVVAFGIADRRRHR